MLGIDIYAQSLFYLEYSIYTPAWSLWIKGCQLFRNWMWDAAQNKSIGLELRAINEVRKRIYYILDDIFLILYQSDLRIDALAGHENITRYRYLPDCRIFPGHGRPGIKTWRNSCRNPGYGNFPGYNFFSGYGYNYNINCI